MKRFLRSWLALCIALSAVCPAGAVEARQAAELPKTQPPINPAQYSLISAQLPTALPGIPAALPSAALETVIPNGSQMTAAAPVSVTATVQLQTAAQPASAGTVLFDGGKTGWRARVSDLATMGQVAVAAHFVSIFPNALTHGAAHPVMMGALWYGASEGMANVLAETRRTVVGGWQASHDQRYRIDPNTGELRDVRGHKYGSDRYEEYAPGQVSVGERLLAAAASAGMGLLWVGSDLKHALIYGATFLFLSAATALLRRGRAPPRAARSAEEKAHAARFN